MKEETDGKRSRIMFKLFYINPAGDLITPLCDNREAAYTFMNTKLSEGCICWMKEESWVEGTED